MSEKTIVHVHLFWRTVTTQAPRHAEPLTVSCVNEPCYPVTVVTWSDDSETVLEPGESVSAR